MKTCRVRLHGFTLIELMVVVGIMGIILLIGIPSIYQLRKESIRQAVNDVVEVCSHARARAIMGGGTTLLVFHPRDRRLEIEGAGGGENAASPPGNPGTSARLPDDVNIEMLDINLLEYRESDVARVRFFPDGSSDEMTLILRSADNDWRAITLEITTGRAIVESDPQKFGR